ncbi:hypothetical protein GQ600_2478 [Phytophthora cactorum]|nr:hypothetical protein GQ600_2478 [Phytophthora cactorum]
MGPRRDITKELTEMLKDLKLFKEILRITHVQHAFRDELPDPLGSLKMEYDKLKGELMLGNGNPDIHQALLNRL